MSYEDALAEAKENVGAEAIDVIPFRNADSNQQYIAVITDPPKDKTREIPDPNSSEEEKAEFYFTEEYRCAHTQVLHQCYPIKILQKTEGYSPEVLDIDPDSDPDLAAYDSAFDADNIEFVDGKLSTDALTPEPDYRNSLLGVIDVDEDGNKEVYSMFRATPSAGTGLYTIKIRLYDSLTGELYELKGKAEPTSTTVNPHFTGKRPKEEFSTWMHQKADALVLNRANKVKDEEWEQLTEEERQDKEIQEWKGKNGVGFDEGQLNIEEHKGPIPEPPDYQSGCSVDEEAWEWRAYRKGALFGYDKVNDTHFVIWVSKSNYDFITDMVAGKRYLWLGVVKEDGLLVFDKEAQALVVIPVPELKGADLVKGHDYPRVFLQVTGSSLYYKPYWWSSRPLTPVTLPDAINAEDEFESATGCDPRQYGIPPNVVK